MTQIKRVVKTHSDANALFDPEFLRKRMSAFEHERVGKEWDGIHFFLQHGQPGKDDIILISNDYLCLSQHTEIIQAQVDTLQKAGNGVMMSAVFLPFLTESSPQHQFEVRFARFARAEAAILCQSGWAANVGLLQCVANPDVPVYIDQMAHMSLWEGIRNAEAQARPFRHNNPEHLERLVAQHGQGVIIVDALYSTHGAICPLEPIVEIAERQGCVLIVDESHSLGTYGENGEGLVPALGLSERVHFRTASLSKAFCGRAGIITCSRRFAEYFPYESRPAIFSSGLLPHEIAGLEATLNIIRSDHWRRERLHSNADYLRREFDRLGYNVEASQSQIISLEAGTGRRIGLLRDALQSRGIHGAIFATPATSRNRMLMRFSIHCGLDRNQLARIVEVCEEIRDEVELWQWSSTRRKARQKLPEPVQYPKQAA